MKKIWNGFDTDPHTLPDNCIVCMGGVTGDFLALPCGHGAPGDYPIHVECAIRSFEPAVDDAKIPPRCPACRTTVDADTLMEVTNYVTQNSVISFPDNDDLRQEKNIYDTDADKIKLLSIISNAHDYIPNVDTLEPTNDELSLKYYEDMMIEAERMDRDIRSRIEEHEYTLEDMEQKEQDIGFMKRQIENASGRLALFAHHNWVFFEFDFTDLYARLVESKNSLEATGKNLREQREEKQKEEEEEHRHHHAV